MSSKTTTRDAVPEDFRQLLDANDLAAIENEWLARVDSAPEDVEVFVAVGERLAEVDKDMASILLQTLDDELEERQIWGPRLELLRRKGHTFFKPPELHDAIVASMSGLYAARDSWEHLADKIGLGKGKDDLRKTWQKVERLEGLMAFEVGTIVTMKDKGAARIEEVNLALENFLVKFDNGLELRVGFGGAAKILEPLAPDHILRRKLERPEELEALRDDDPSELLRLVLQCENRPLLSTEVKQILEGIVSPSRWSRWWAAARKHPQVLNDPKNKRAYIWVESSEDAQDAVWQAFEKAAPQRQIEMLRREGERDESLRRRMADTLARRAAHDRAKKPGLAAEIWVALERADVPADSSVDWSPHSLASTHEDLRAVISGIEDRIARERLYEVVRTQRDNWPEVYVQALWLETDARSIDKLVEPLLEAHGELFDQLFDQLVSQPRKAPATFTWLVERAAERPAWLERNPVRLMNQLLFAITADEFAPYRAARLAPLLESGGTLPRLLDHLTEDQASAALDTVKKSPALEDYHRQPLSNAIRLRFPNLDKDTEQPLYATQAQIRAKRAELKQLAEEEIPENRAAIESARELGDLRENFEYHAARRRHEYLSARATNLNEDLSRVRPIDAKNVTGEEIVIGTRVTFDGENGTQVYTILGPWESDPDQGVLSNESDLAQSLLGKTKGDEVMLPDGAFTVAAIEAWE
ncbi:MAG: GreA/GreB family elongation factor [Acidobacteriota bacterium]